jgi:hypothetical protein
MEVKRFARAVAGHPVVWLWFKKSATLLWGTLLYNLFAVFVLQPILRKWFPPLTPWEKVTRVFAGTSRYTYRDILPYAGPAIWILGNGFLFALLNRKLREARSTVRGPGPVSESRR